MNPRADMLGDVAADGWSHMSGWWGMPILGWIAMVGFISLIAWVAFSQSNSPAAGESDPLDILDRRPDPPRRTPRSVRRGGLSQPSRVRTATASRAASDAPRTARTMGSALGDRTGPIR